MRTLSILFLVIPSILAWGKVGHTLTGQIASKLMKPATLTKLRKILPADFKGDVGRATTWADEVKRAKGYAGWSGPLHYSDTHDSPSKSCAYNYEKDCPDGKCIVGAISNYTQRLGCKNSAAVREEAAKFLTHFIGDITQPLHLCARDRGGNQASIKFDRKTTNLHSVWDSSLLEKKMKADFENSQPQFLDALLKEATTTFKKESSEWTSCLRADGNVALDCPAEWASDSNEMNCSSVWPAYDEDSTQNFGEQYYEDNIGLAEKQIIKAGVRMAAWFDKFVGEASCGSEENTEEMVAAGGKVGWLYQ